MISGTANAPARLLIIDDDPVQHRLVAGMVRAFRHSRYECDHATSFAEGLERLVNGHYTACLLDYQLDQDDGLALLREALRTSQLQTPVIMVTASDTEDVNIAASESGAVDFLVKGDINPRVLERALRYAVRLGATLAQLQAMAIKDELTGLPNRREMQRRLHDEWQRATRFRRPLTVGMVDIDFFKKVNDEHGHPAGDEVIRHVAQLLQRNVRAVDRVARYGGEEFALLLPETSLADATTAVERIRCIIEETPCVIADPPLSLSVTVSIGAAATVEESGGPEVVVAAADRRLYLAKRGGRNRVVAEG